jgi:hypothetical protein
VTLNLSGAKNHGCRAHLRGSVRRASGFVLTGYTEVIGGQAFSITGGIGPIMRKIDNLFPPSGKV